MPQNVSVMNTGAFSQLISKDFKKVFFEEYAKQPEEFSKIFKIAKETGVVYLELSKEEIPVLIQNLQTHPINDQLLHVDFRKVDLTKKIETAVPVKTVGVSEAVAQKGGVLLTQADELKIEAQPEKIPHQIEIDLSVLKEINQEIKVADLPQNPDYKIIDPADKVIVSVVAHKEETVVPETTSTPPEIITEKGEPTKEPLSSSSNDSEKTKEEKKQ